MQNYTQIKDCLRAMQPFHGHSSHASIDKYTCDNEMVCNLRQTDHFVVTSYNTQMFSKCMECGAYSFNNKSYSVTTSKLQNMIIDAFELDKGAGSTITKKRQG